MRNDSIPQPETQRTTPLITIFNGRRRSLGAGDQQEFYAQVSVEMRDLLSAFKGAKLSVFLCIALHTNVEGWAQLKIATIARKTGHNPQTVSRAVSSLATLAINGDRVLLVVQSRDDDKSFDSNRYLIFPTEADIAALAVQHPQPELPVGKRKEKRVAPAATPPKKAVPPKRQEAPRRTQKAQGVPVATLPETRTSQLLDSCGVVNSREFGHLDFAAVQERITLIQRSPNWQPGAIVKSLRDSPPQPKLAEGNGEWSEEERAKWKTWGVHFGSDTSGIPPA